MDKQINKNRKRVLVGMSGGVDSSVSAVLLVEQGYDVTGGFIKNWSDTKDLWTGECEWRGERRDALRVAAKLDIDLLTFDFEEEYRERVLKTVFDEYEEGVTPNPDVLCNQEIKFGLFHDAARRLGFDYVATGHYARVERDEDGAHLLKGNDPDKDQSYFLHRISRDALAHALFPIGHLRKSEVRALAEKFELPVAHKPDSQGICFIGKLDFHDFLRKKIPPAPGDIVTPEGEVVGRHDGIDAYTIGQRQGLQVSKDGKAWYVAAKDRKRNRLIVVPDREHALLYRTHIRLRKTHLLNDLPDDGAVQVAVRYRTELVPGIVIPSEVEGSLSGGISPLASLSRNDEMIIHFSKPVWAPAPGQSAVIYSGDECLGGGFIDEESVEYPQA